MTEFHQQGQSVGGSQQNAGRDITNSFHQAAKEAPLKAEETPKIKVLFLAANPKSTSRLAIDEEMHAIEQKVRASEYREVLIFQSAWAVRPDDLLQLLNQHHPHIVHFSGHGSRKGLSFVGNDGQSRLVTTRALKAVFTTLKENVRVVLLNACYSREQALALVETIDCVIGMNESIHDTAAAAFASSFYRALGFGRSLQEAFDQGIASLLLEGIPDEYIPELLVKEGVETQKVVLIVPGHSVGSSEDRDTRPMSRKQVLNIPYPHNPDFTGRDTLLDQLHSQLQESREMALLGLGGVGKTQLALEYAYRYYKEYKAVLWIRADSQDALISSFVDLADQIKLPVRNESDQNIIVKAVLNWLHKSPNCLLIFDDVVDPQLIHPYLSQLQTCHGHTLLTTCSRDLNRLMRSIEVNKLDAEQGTLFLLRRLRLLVPKAQLQDAQADDIMAAQELNQEMGGLPLALDQAAAYIAGRGCGLDDYLSLYRKHPKTLLEQRGDPMNDHSKSVATTFALSFQRIRQSDPIAADLFTACAFLHPDAIPEQLFTDGASHLGPYLQNLPKDPFGLNNALGPLYSYSLIGRNNKAKTFNVHSLLQTVITNTIMDEETQQNWAQRVVRAVNEVFPRAEFGQWDLCERYLPHAHRCAQLIKDRKMLFPDAAHLLNKAAYYLRERAQYADAKSLLEQAHSICEQLETDYPLMAECLNDQALLGHDQGDYPKAEALHQNALRIREQRLGAEHLDTAESLNNLANLYSEQGRYKEAKPLYQRSLRIREKQLGPEHPKVTQTRNNLAILSKLQDGYEEAKLLYQRNPHNQEEQLGFEHPDVARLLNNLGVFYAEYGKYTESERLYSRAERLFQRSRIIWEKQGCEGSNFAQSLCNLANLCIECGNYEEATQLYKKSQYIYQQIYQQPEKHPDVAYPFHGLGIFYTIQHNYIEAEALFRHSYEIWELSLQSEHPQVVYPLYNLAVLYTKQGKYEEAKRLFEHSKDIWKYKLGDSHFHTKTCEKNYTILWRILNGDVDALGDNLLVLPTYRSFRL